MKDNPQAVCPITHEPATVADTTGDYVEFNCPSCGHFRISRTVLIMLPDNPEVLRHELYRAKSLTKAGEIPLIANVVGG